MPKKKESITDKKKKWMAILPLEGKGVYVLGINDVILANFFSSK